MTLLSEQGEIEFVSASVTDLLGYAREDLVGRVAFELVHPHDMDRVQQQFREAAAEGGSVSNLRYRYRHKDGSWRAVSTHLQGIRHPRHPGLIAHSHVAGEAVA